MFCLSLKTFFTTWVLKLSKQSLELEISFIIKKTITNLKNIRKNGTMYKQKSTNGKQYHYLLVSNQIVLEPD